MSYEISKQQSLQRSNPESRLRTLGVVTTAPAGSPVARLIAALLLLLGWWVSPAQAQGVPDAGALRQQIEREFDATPLPPAAPPTPAETPPRTPAPGEATVAVKQFRFAGNTRLDDEALQAVVAPWRDRTLGFEELQRAARAVAEAYRDAGWIVNAFLPRQDVTDGTVTVQVVESTFGGARLEAPAPTLVDPIHPMGLIEARQAVGEPLRVEQLDRGLLLADDLPGVRVSGALEPGKEAGQTALAVRMQDEPRIDGGVFVDNSGPRATGAARIIGGVGLNSPLKLGDRLRVDGMHSEGSDFGRLAYNLPIGRDGWRVGVNASQLDYRLVTDEFAALGVKGRSRSLGLEASHPVIRSRQRNLYLNLAIDDRQYLNQANGETQSDYKVRAATIGLSGNLFDRIGGGGSNAASLAWVTGRVNQGQANVGENPQVNGRFNKVRVAASRDQTISRDLALQASMAGQWANRDLDSSERFYLGGPDGVRAYPVNEGAGSRGVRASVELRWRLPAGLVASTFYDWGHATTFGAGPSPTLKGPGASIAWTGPLGLNLKATIAVRDGHNPNPTITGSDQDGSKHRVRLWMQASIPF